MSTLPSLPKSEDHLNNVLLSVSSTPLPLSQARAVNLNANNKRNSVLTKAHFGEHIHTNLRDTPLSRRPVSHYTPLTNYSELPEYQHILNPDSDQNTIPPKEIPPSTISVVSQTHSEHSQPSKHSSSPLISIADIMKYKNNLDKKIKASFKMISLTIFVSAVSMTISAYRIDSFLANLPNSETRVSNNLRHQFEYGFWSLAFISTLFHLMLSTTLLIICLIHLYCAYSITKTMNNTDQAVMSYFNSTSIWRNIIAYFYLVSLMFTVVINTCLVFVVPANIGQYSKATIFATGAFLCIFIMMVAFHTLFKWCKLSKDDEKMCQYQPQQIYSPIHTHHGKIDIKSLSTLV